MIFKPYIDDSHLHVSCNKEQIAKLKKAGYNSKELIYPIELENFLKDKDFGLPKQNEERDWYFTMEHKYARVYQDYLDALIEEISLLRKLKLL